MNSFIKRLLASAIAGCLLFSGAALAMGGGIAVMTVIAGFLFEHWQGGVFWVMAAVAVPALFIRPPAVSVSR